MKLAHANRDILRLLLDHVHNRPVHLEALTVWKMIAFAKHYQIDDLLDRCHKFLVDRIAPHNCIELSKEINQNGDEDAKVNVELSDRIDQFLINNFELVSAHVNMRANDLLT